jgi:hypothetical protein
MHALTVISFYPHSWFKYLPDYPLVKAVFLGSDSLQGEDDVAMQMFRKEQAEHGDIVLVNAPDGYEGLWRKSLLYLKSLVDRHSQPDAPPPPRYVMHAGECVRRRACLVNAEKGLIDKESSDRCR